MAIREVRTSEDEILRKISRKVENVDEKILREQITYMITGYGYNIQNIYKDIGTLNLDNPLPSLSKLLLECGKGNIKEICIANERILGNFFIKQLKIIHPEIIINDHKFV